jgi:hypothetical protein
MTKLLSFQLSEGYLQFEGIENFESSEQLQQFLTQDSESAKIFKTRLLELALASLLNDLANDEVSFTKLEIEEV